MPGRFSVYKAVPHEAQCFFRTTLSCFAWCSQKPECDGSKQREGCGCGRKASCSQPGEALANCPCAYLVFLHCHPLTTRWIKTLPFDGQLKFEQSVFIKYKPEYNTVEMQLLPWFDLNLISFRFFSKTSWIFLIYCCTRKMCLKADLGDV